MLSIFDNKFPTQLVETVTHDIVLHSSVDIDGGIGVLMWGGFS